MNKIKRVLASVCAVVLTVSMLTACGGKDDKKETKLTTSMITGTTTTAKEQIDFDKLVIPEKKLVIDGKEVDTTDLIVMTINDKYQISFDEYRFFYQSALYETGVDFSQIKEDKLDESYKLVKDYVEDVIKDFYANFIIAENNGVEITSKIEDEIEVTYQQYIEEYEGEENFKKLLMSEYYTVDVWKHFCRAQLLVSDIYDALYDEGGKYYKSEDDFKEFAKTEDYMRIKHILIPYAAMAELTDEEMEGFDELTLTKKLTLKETAYEKVDEEGKKKIEAETKKHAEEVLKLVTDGGDFDKLIEEYNWDPGMESYPEGYFITENTSFVEEFIDASLKLKIGEVSGLVESDYGYHILKREAVDEKYVEENIDELYYDYFNEYLTAVDAEMRTEIIDNMQITYFDGYEKLDANSVS